MSTTPGQDALDGQFASKMTQEDITLVLGGSVGNAIGTARAMGPVVLTVVLQAKGEF